MNREVLISRVNLSEGQEGSRVVVDWLSMAQTLFLPV